MEPACLYSKLIHREQSQLENVRVVVYSCIYLSGFIPHLSHEYTRNLR